MDINYNNNENIEENKESNLIQENNNIELNVDEILKNSQNEQVNFENTVNINPQQNFTSYTGPVLTQSTNKTLIQESTLPLKYSLFSIFSFLSLILLILFLNNEYKYITGSK